MLGNEPKPTFVRNVGDGLLQVDRLLHEFFLPEHLTKRMV